MKPDYASFSAEDTANMEEMTGVSAKAMLNALVLDNACGAGVLTSLFFNAAGKTDDVRVVCGDVEEYMVKCAADRIKTNGWNAEAVVVDALAIPYPDNHFTHNLMNFGIQVIPDNVLALKESFRVLQCGGEFGMTCGTPPWLESFPSLDLSSRQYHQRTDVLQRGYHHLLAAAGFININVQSMQYEHTNNMARYLGYLKELLSCLLVEETAEKYDA
ncbi:S-adenosyl-L-methionine-dependent methyltransferase [Mycena crocata]|nr:S-adenosyl-L-methionine-dependent methyltransferase [Mycena crocata]